MRRRRRSDQLPRPQLLLLRRALALAASPAAAERFFRHLGYFGRCSFDAILVGGDPAAWQLHWVECNGRWGGTSIPMTLANRLVGDWRRVPFVVVDRRGAEPGSSVEFGRLLEEIGDDLFVPGVREVGMVLLRPGGPAAGLAFMAFGETVPAARAQADRTLNRAFSRAFSATGPK